MEGRRKNRPHTTTSRIDLPEYENSLMPISTYPNISAFTERGQIVIGYMEPVGAVAIAAERRQALAMVRRRKDETFNYSPASTWPSPAPLSTTSTWTK
jgi:hypothetical protein